MQPKGFLKADLENNFKGPGIGFIGNMVNGQVSGPFWVGLLGGGYLHGKTDINGSLTGKKRLKNLQSNTVIYLDFE